MKNKYDEKVGLGERAEGRERERTSRQVTVTWVAKLFQRSFYQKNRMEKRERERGRKRDREIQKQRDITGVRNLILHFIRDTKWKREGVGETDRQTERKRKRD